VKFGQISWVQHPGASASPSREFRDLLRRGDTRRHRRGTPAVVKTWATSPAKMFAPSREEPFASAVHRAGALREP